MKETIRLFFTQFNDTAISITSALMVFISVCFFLYWLYNRKRYQKMAHQIPASVVKSYLDSIIQNSSSLKSSLFRGGGLDISDGVPSVLPIGEVLGGSNLSGKTDSVELAKKTALIQNLEAKLSEKSHVVVELEKKYTELEEKLNSSASSSDQNGIATEAHELVLSENRNLKNEIENLKKAVSSDDRGGELVEKIQVVEKERDQLKEKLQEYEIIEDDLANLKRLQQENEELKKSIQQLQGSVTASSEEKIDKVENIEQPREEGKEETKELSKDEAAAEEEAIKEVEASPTEEVSSSAPEDITAEMSDSTQKAASEDKEEGDVDPELNEGEKSQEDLLSEFEKMLG